MNSMEKPRVIVVGGGAAGLLASGTAAKYGADVVLLEKMSRPGRKLRITGNSRCNLTNIASKNDFITHFGKNGKFLEPSFKAFFSNDLIALLKELGVDIIVESGGKVFPSSEKAQDVVDALVGWVERQKVKIIINAAVSRLSIKQDRITGVEISASKHANAGVMQADSVIIATGGKSYPATGSTGDGYGLAETAGHSVVPFRPALVPLKTKSDIAARLEGLGLSDIAVKLLINGKKKAEDFKEVMFTGFGLSGPAILSLSKYAVDALAAGHSVEVTIDLKPKLDLKALDNELLSEIKTGGKKQYKSLLKSLLASKLVPVFIDLTKIPEDTLLHQLTAEQRKILRNLLKDFRFEIAGPRDFNEAIITAGGINLRQINPATLESRLVSGLYFAGEVMDIDADTGGYNLQAAFSTGFQAGKSAASKSRR